MFVPAVANALLNFVVVALKVVPKGTAGFRPKNAFVPYARMNYYLFKVNCLTQTYMEQQSKSSDLEEKTYHFHI